MATNGGSRSVSLKVNHTASFASVASVAPTASVAKEETRFYGERVSDLLDNLRSQGLFSPFNFDDKLAGLRRREKGI